MMHDDTGDGMGGMMDQMGVGMMGAMAGSMLVWALVGIGLLVLLVVTIARLLRDGTRGGDSGPGGNRHPDSAEEVLRRRYAAGEIDDTEYQRLRAGLS